MIDKITFCIPSRNNLRYLQDCIPSIRRNLTAAEHQIIIFVDEDTDGTVDWCEKNKEVYNFRYIVNPNLNKSRFGIGPAYDKCISEAETEVVMIAHADMVFGRDCDVNILKQLKKKTVVAATRVEPPNYPNAGEKIQKAFGQYPEDFEQDKFDEFVESQLSETKTTEGIFAPWCLYKSDYDELGGHDARLHSCREDSDIFNRMLLAGFTFVQPWNALVWHYGGRGAGSNTKFDNEEDRLRHEKWKHEMNASTREFIRKWKSQVRHEPLMKPIVNPVYDIGIRIFNGNLNLIATLEPFFTDVYTDFNTLEYIENEQYQTTENLLSKFHPLENLGGQNDILVTIDGNTFNQNTFNQLMLLSQIIKNQNQTGKFKLDNMEVEISRIEEKQNELIKIK